MKKFYLLLTCFLTFSQMVNAADVDPNSLTCEGLGFDTTEAKCKAGVIRCPFDTSKVSCIDAYVGEIRIFGGPESKIPNGWIIADGRGLYSSTYRELYNAIGTAFGGSSTYFYIPNLTGKFPLGTGNSSTAGSTNHSLATTGGAETVTLSDSQIPSHDHGYTGYLGNGKPDGSGDTTDPGWDRAYPRGSQIVSKGSGSSHQNMPPFLTIDYIIFTGVY